ncbi:ATP-dependent DNA helicase RecG [Neobittarella massiliensis]|uniref:ATP-dependent DNA helicase RecG n=1 Tax=Neobittarella massiliensis (ex Bilen et al. 2018) TaxID=2041842 RepID=UPI000CF60041|nr:ATP-dependent DNA helicase RecG [Neobittarella massiliensis]
MKDLFSVDIQFLKGVGPKRAQLYQKLGVDSVGSLLQYYPRSYIDLHDTVPLSAAPFDSPCAVQGRVVRKLPVARLSGGRNLYKVLCTDYEQDFAVTFFNTPYPYGQLVEGEDYIFYGKFGGTFTGRQVGSPLFIPAGQPHDVLPVYPLTKGLTSKEISRSVAVAIDAFLAQLADPLPSWVRTQYDLCHIGFAVQNIHLPQSPQAAQLARRRLIFEELLVLQLGMALLKQRTRRRTDYRLIPPDLAPFTAALPYQLTGAQRRCIGEILTDLQRPQPMSRLLQGDVGSGKTVVAAAGVYAAAQNGAQSALMAPTEILAEQHYQTLNTLLQPLGITVALLTGSTKGAAKKALLADLAAGKIDLLVGTHALISQNVTFSKLALVVTDEQHRFGVKQRGALGEKGQYPHMLVMSATPIPRTLALIIYGDLDISVLDEKPAGRREIETFAVDFGKFRRAVAFAEKQIRAGGQVYVVCPLIEDSGSELKDAATAQQQIQQLLPHRRVGLLHGRMRPKEKEAVMAAFKQKQLDLLVSTTVIEVGVDVPDANLIIVQNAERFGLSALHQLRGRVGRSDRQSYCILISDAQGETAKKRLDAMCRTSDGFALANFDLELRGPGDFFGSAQHGLPKLKIADLLQDRMVLAQTGTVCRQLLDADPQLRQNPLLRAEVGRLFSQVGQQGLN